MIARYAIITGASRGLGQHLARRFWEAGYSLGLVARSTDGLQKTVEAFKPAEGQQWDLFGCDFSDIESINGLIKDVVAKISTINVLINNAAIQGPIGPLSESEFAEWQKTIQINLIAPVALCRGLIGRMAGASDATIINLSGGGATGPRPNFSAYASAKAALVRFSETLAEEVKEHGIAINCIAPGAMKTAMLAEVLKCGVDHVGRSEFTAATKVYESGGASMDRVADLALFLSSPAARGINGKLVSAVWDQWDRWPHHLKELTGSDLYTLRRISGRDRGCEWGDK